MSSLIEALLERSRQAWRGEVGEATRAKARQGSGGGGGLPGVDGTVSGALQLAHLNATSFGGGEILGPVMPSAVTPNRSPK